ncbi:hypothetical protein J5A56_00545 [Prevotella melaninogenica]|uniref:hypothetical protein n=1 Tax=Prevotella TaxID=838 RepID=UPI0003ACED2C|nr:MULTISPECIES: hypothetical protein [Prevotella]ERJ80050.1 hypothetical protein HMPREF9148_00136 [Prevotella sp. F0091]QUB72925.1 hypothetical protein J5A56_00545 [Prevotella melaninogenica]
MKARVKNTGEIVEISPSGVTTVQRTCTKYATKDGRELLDMALDFLPNINWEQRRYEIAKSAMIGILSAPIVEGVNPNPSYKDVATFSIRLADALIKELKGSEE